jgi:hypothetical protein
LANSVHGSTRAEEFAAVYARRAGVEETPALCVVVLGLVLLVRGG